MADDDLTIPDFLKLTDEQRKKAWEKFKPKKIRNVVVVSDPRKPHSMSDEDWEKLKAQRKEEERKRAAELEAAKKAKAPVPVVDTKGKRWDQRRGRWVEDNRPSPPAKPSAPIKKPKAAPSKAVPASGFGIPEGTNRDKLAKAMAKRIGEMVSLVEWSKAVYGKENASACDRVMNGFILDLKKRKLKFEIIKDKNAKGQIAYGLFEITE
jgi:hypothetical protein